MKRIKVRFCWECSRKLQGNHYTIKFIDGARRVLHKTCAKLYEKELTIEIHPPEEIENWMNPFNGIDEEGI